MPTLRTIYPSHTDDLQVKRRILSIIYPSARITQTPSESTDIIAIKDDSRSRHMAASEFWDQSGETHYHLSVEITSEEAKYIEKYHKGGMTEIYAESKYAIIYEIPDQLPHKSEETGDMLSDVDIFGLRWRSFSFALRT